MNRKTTGSTVISLDLYNATHARKGAHSNQGTVFVFVSFDPLKLKPMAYLWLKVAPLASMIGE